MLRYTRDLLTPQAWVGQDAYPGSDPAVFLEHNRAVTKRWAEQLRFQRGQRTAGFMLFSAECWFAHSYDAGRAEPYPVYEAMRDAWAPIGLALETGRRRFYAGEEFETAAFITNDDEQFRDLRDLTLRAAFVDERTGKQIAETEVGEIDNLPYYATVRQRFKLRVPQTREPRRQMQLLLQLNDSSGEVSRTLDRVEIFAPIPPVRLTSATTNSRAVTLSLGEELTRVVNEARIFPQITNDMPPNSEAARSVVLIGGEGDLKDLAPNGRGRELVELGATAILFSPGKSVVDLFPNDVLEIKKVTGEYADYAPSAGTKLTEGLRAMDIKWWGRKNDWRVFVASSAHRLKPGGAARELVRFIPSHGYIPAERVPEQYLTVLFEIPLGQGRVWVCDLDLEESVRVDPAARLLAINILRAAADVSSTKNLPLVPSHKESLAGRLRAITR